MERSLIILFSRFATGHYAESARLGEPQALHFTPSHNTSRGEEFEVKEELYLIFVPAPFDHGHRKRPPRQSPQLRIPRCDAGRPQSSRNASHAHMRMISISLP